MDQDKKAIMDFWYQFDNFFLFRRPAEITNALDVLDPYGKLLDRFLYHYQRGSVETDFKGEHENIKDSIKLLANSQLRIMDDHFKGNTETEQTAFELFAQGLLFDNGLDDNGLPRRPEGDKIHMMDSSIIGYIVWHAFIRLVVLLYGDDGAIDSNKWLQTDRHIGLAAGILAALIKSGREPEQSNDPTYNKPIDPTLLEALRADWVHLNFQNIDDKLAQLRLDTISEHT
jgi:hypothetical protein